jgi:hypothetical protein
MCTLRFDCVCLQVSTQLRQLPPPLVNPTHALAERLRKISKAVKVHVQGREDVTFYKASEQYYKECRNGILEARPTVQLPAASAEAAAPRPAPTSLSKSDTAFWVKPETPHALAAGREEPGADGIITLPILQYIKSRYHVDMLPEFAPYHVVIELVMPVKGRWGDAAQNCLQLVADELHRLTNRLVQEAFADFSAAQGSVRQVQAA